MEHENKESPAREKLTIEHVMPQKLTEQWRGDLGEGSEEIHDRYVHRLANLTLSGYNAEMGAAQFHQKRKVYEKSAIGMTRRLADENEWNEDALERRSEDLAVRVLRRWPWHDQGVEQAGSPPLQAPLQWRLEDGPWHPEEAASQMVLNVAGALLSRDPNNAQRLSGDSISNNLQLASQYPPGTASGTLMMRAVPGHDQYVLYPYDRDYSTSAARCCEMGKRCSALIEVEFQKNVLTPAFWRFLRAHVGGVPGQKESWQGANQWTAPLNSHGDKIGIYVGNPDQLWLYIRAGQGQTSEDRAARMLKYSRSIREHMSDQVLGKYWESESRQGQNGDRHTALDARGRRRVARGGTVDRGAVQTTPVDHDSAAGPDRDASSSLTWLPPSRGDRLMGGGALRNGHRLEDVLDSDALAEVGRAQTEVRLPRPAALAIERPGGARSTLRSFANSRFRPAAVSRFR